MGGVSSDGNLVGLSWGPLPPLRRRTPCRAGRCCTSWWSLSVCGSPCRKASSPEALGLQQEADRTRRASHLLLPGGIAH